MKHAKPFDRVRRLGLALPDAEDSTYWGTPALKLRGQWFACLASHSSAEPNTLVVRTAIPDRDELIAADPETYYVTDHYVNYPTTLVRLPKIGDEALRDLLLMAWRGVESKRKTSRPSAAASRPRASGRAPSKRPRR